MRKALWGMTGMAFTVALVACGVSPVGAPPSPHHGHQRAKASSPVHSTSVLASQGVPISWTRLPLRSQEQSPTLIAGISVKQGHGLILDLASYSTMHVIHPVKHLVLWQVGRHTVSSVAAGTTFTPGPGSAYSLVPTTHKTLTPKIMDGTSVASVSWPGSIPVYESGANPFGDPFGVNNRVIGQSGSWIWVALKGPARPTAKLPPGVWGFRHWDRLVALNVITGQYRLFGLPASQSQMLTYPLWAHPPAFAATAHHVYVGVGAFIGVFPANPLTAGPVQDHGKPSTTLTANRVHRALTVLNQASWNAVNADAQFWNCYVMKDPSQAACPAGSGVPTSTALSLDPVYFNHGSVGFSILWASQLAMPASDAALRAQALTRLQQGLKASLEMAWIGNPSSKALRQKYGSGPPNPLPGYYRKNHLYWAKSS